MTDNTCRSALEDDEWLDCEELMKSRSFADWEELGVVCDDDELLGFLPERRSASLLANLRLAGEATCLPGRRRICNSVTLVVTRSPEFLM